MLLVLTPVDGILLGPSLLYGSVDVPLDGQIKRLEILERGELPIGRLVLRTEFDLVGQVLALRLHGQVISRLVVGLVLCREPNHLILVSEPGQNFLVCLLIDILRDDGLDLLEGRLCVKLVLKMGMLF